MKTLKGRLRELRGSLSQADFASKLGVTQQTYGNWENGNTEPKIDKIIEISQDFFVTVDWLFGRSDIRTETSKPEPPPSRDRQITDEDVSKIIDQNSKLSNAAQDLGQAHKELMSINGELARELVEMCKESRKSKGCTPARNVKTGGGSATKAAS
jgi:transcriptional regulator with XRE-family HTH domain